VEEFASSGDTPPSPSESAVMMASEPSDEPATVAVVNMGNGQQRYEVPVMTLWSEIISGIPGTYDDKKRYQYETREFGTLHYNTITKIMVDKFGAKSKRKSDGAVLVFDKEKLERFARSYTESYDSDRIRVNPIQDDDTEGDEGSKIDLIEVVYIYMPRGGRLKTLKCIAEYFA
jgi:hypothetical protein